MEKRRCRRTVIVTVLITVLVLFPRLDFGRAIDYHNFVNEPTHLYPEGEVLNLRYRQIAPVHVVPIENLGYNCYIAKVWGREDLRRQCERWRRYSEPFNENKIPSYIPAEAIDAVFYFTSEKLGEEQYLLMVVYGDYGFIFWEAKHWAR